MIIEEHINDYPIKSAYFRHCYMIYNKDITKVYIFNKSSTDARARLLLYLQAPLNLPEGETLEFTTTKRSYDQLKSADNRSSPPSERLWEAEKEINWP